MAYLVSNLKGLVKIVPMLRCALSLVVAAYAETTPHSSVFARFACDLFSKPSPLKAFGDFIEGVNN
jgi:hypothetical protein